MLTTWKLVSCLLASAAVRGIGGQAIITNDSDFFGQSPPVYPSPEAPGLGSWEAAYKKAKSLVEQMTIEEKVNLTTGYAAPNGCGGNIYPIPRLGFPGLCLSDAGNGLRGTDFVSSWPSGIHVGASWNKDLSRKRAVAMAGEFKRKGVNILLGPVVGPLGRVVEGGRNFEGFSVDPYLSGALVYESVSGIQEAGVIATTKHYIVNEQETNRNPLGNVSAVSSNLDDTTLHESYLWPFQDALHAGSGAIMCSYQRVNNSYGCQNSKLLNGVLKTELGFEGLVMSDWGALHAGYHAALAGMDMVMPDGGGFWGANLTRSVNNGSLPEQRLDDMAIRVISTWYQMGQDEGFLTPGIGMPAVLTLPHEKIDARNISEKPTLFDGAVEGHVLVKNVNNTLPLSKPGSLFLAGYSAKAPDQNGPSDADPLVKYLWPLGLESAISYLYALAAMYLGTGQSVTVPPIAANGTIIGGGGSGSVPQATFIAPFDALVTKADEDNTQLFWDFNSSEPAVVQSSDACLVFVNAFSSEMFDRPSLRDDYTDGLILSVASQCANTIVIIHNVGPRLVDQWIDHPNVTAVIFAHLPGQDSGKAIVSLLYGKSQFSGKLPYTVARNESDYGDVLSPSIPSGEFQYFPQSDFNEGVYIDYRYFGRENIEPRFEFGFGLSYTSFDYSELKIETTSAPNLTIYPIGTVVQGGPIDLWDVLARVFVTVSNTGALDGPEVAQLYVGSPGGPKKQLRGFSKPFIKAGESATLTFELTRRDLSSWDVVHQAWRLSAGPHQIFVGSSSRSLPLTSMLQLPLRS
ncbi:glycoside hydrolase family 3 protein [Hypomontagnella monticulosa]|nr:glycoside hydrolase family 3 protein [Hypomontagnella monticulosa]